MREAVIVACGRSAIGKSGRGSLSNTRPEDVTAQVVRGVLNQIPEFDYREIDDFILGCAFPEAEQGLNIARLVALQAGLPAEVPGQTVNRFCSSGLQTIATAANSIIAGQVDIVLAGGVEFMSTVPMGGNFQAPNPKLVIKHPEAYLSMGMTAENVAVKYGVTRKMQDEFAVNSNRKAAMAREEGKFEHEIIPVTATRISEMDGKKTVKEFEFATDEGIRPNSSVEALSNLRTVFKMNGTVTPGNSSQTSDGAAVVLMMSREKAEMLGLEPLATFRSFAAAGVPPEIMGIGPIAAIPKALKTAGLSKDDIGLFELNEAFAAQAIACINELELPQEIVNVNGGAIAHGHPLGATGAMLTVKLISEMRRRDVPYGVVSMCIGGGMGAAAVFEITNK